MVLVSFSPYTEEKEEDVTPNQQSEAESTHPQSQKPDLQAQKEKASRLSSNWLKVPVNTPGSPPSPVQRTLSTSGLEHQYQPQIGQRANSVLNGLNQFKAQQLAQDYSVQRQDSSGESQIEEPEEKQPESLHNQQLASSPPDNPEDNTASGSDSTLSNLQLQNNKEQKRPQKLVQSDGAIQAKCSECEKQEEKDESVQTKLTVGEPGDKYEQEADTMAAKVMAMPDSTLSQSVGRQTEAEKPPLAKSISSLVQRSASDTSQASPSIENRLASSQGGGNPLPENVRSFMEPRFGADFSAVRVHTDSTAVQMNKELGAQAFAHGSNIYYGAGKSPNVDELTAHELTHTIQQGAAMHLNKQVQRHLQEEEQEILQAKELPVLQREVSQNKPVQLTETLAAKTVPDSTAQASLNKEQSFKPEITEAETEAQPIQAKAYTSLAVSSTSPRIQRWSLPSIPTSLAEAKSAVLSPVANLASSIPGYPLLKVIVGKDPIKGTPVERNATNLIQGVLSLVPKGKEFFANLQKSGAIDKAYTWFTQQIAKLNLTWATIKGLFKKAWDSLGLRDLVSPSSAFAKIKNVFTEPIGRIKNFAITAGKKVMEFVFEGVMGAGGAKVMAILRRTGGVFSTIINDPVKFIGNLVGAVRGGFQQFSGNILSHLKKGLVGWLFGALAGAGLTLPAQFDLKGIFSLVMQVLGLTYQRLRGMLVKLIGEPKVKKLEKLFTFLKTIVTDGLGAAWQKITEFVGNLKDMVIGGIRSWVQNSIITAAITKLISMFNPAGAVIQSVTAIYNTVMFFIERGQQIAALAEAVFSSIGSIAGGNIKAAANYVEQTMGRTLPVVISFLARLIGLGGISEQIKNVIKKIQAPIGNAMQKVANFIVEKGKSLLGKGKGKADKKGKKTDNTESVTIPFSMDGASHTLTLTSGLNAKVSMASTNPGLLSQKVSVAINKLNKNKNKNTEVQERIEALGEIKSKAIQVEKILHNPKASQNDKEKMKKMGIGLTTAILEYGKKYNQKDIDGLLKLYPAPVVGLYNEINDQTPPPDGTTREAHHAPPLELANSLSTELFSASLTLRKKGIVLADDPFEKAAKNIKSVGNKLPAILVHVSTHRVKGAGSRIHGSEIRAELTKTLKRKGISQEETITTSKGEVAVKGQETTYKRYIKKKVQQTLQAGDITAIKLAFKKAYNFAAAQALHQVAIALKSSEVDGSKKGRKAATRNLRKKVKEVWKGQLLQPLN
ncbi:MAG: DUF4157 domain-containing protein [Coleofasciculus sp. D1-CHI-01]|uniref:eCIS core domain-containing protein n=1 Tax=Coleofasciculus sp. D1-CHI-01 TaxID=3068482 RepID=UPI0032F9DC52